MPQSPGYIVSTSDFNDIRMKLSIVSLVLNFAAYYSCPLYSSILATYDFHNK